MDEKQAWERFRQSGSVEDYLKYREKVHEAEHRRIDHKGEPDG